MRFGRGLKTQQFRLVSSSKGCIQGAQLEDPAPKSLSGSRPTLVTDAPRMCVRWLLRTRYNGIFSVHQELILSAGDRVAAPKTTP